MSFEATRATIESYLITGWGASPYSSVPVIPEGMEVGQFGVTDEDDYIVVSISQGEGEPMTLGAGDQWVRYVGVVQIDAMTAEQSGTRQGLLYADTISALLRRARLSDYTAGFIQFRLPSVKGAGIYKGRYWHIVRAPYFRNIKE